MNKLVKEIGKIGLVVGGYYVLYKCAESLDSTTYNKILSKRQVKLIDKTFQDMYNVSGKELLKEVRFRLVGKHPNRLGVNDIASYVITQGGERFIELSDKADVASVVHELTHHLQYTRKILAEEHLNFQATTFEEYWKCEKEVQARKTAKYFSKLSKMSL